MNAISVFRLPAFALLALDALGLCAAPALAAPSLSVAFVSGKGVDNGSCGAVTSPCREIKWAHDNVVLAGGEIVVLDGASYGPFVIRKSISVVNDGTGVADIRLTTAGANAIMISSAGAVVHLRGLSLDGGGVAANGVAVAAAASLTIVNCVARRFAGAGFYIRTGVTTSFVIADSAAEGNNRGFFVVPASGGTARGVLTNVRAIDSGAAAIEARGAAAMTVLDSLVERYNVGVFAYAGASILARDTNAILGSAVPAYWAGEGGVMRLAHSVADGNAIGLVRSSTGVAETFGDNNLRGNVTPVGPGVATVTTQ